MYNRFKEMNCYILARGERNVERDFLAAGEVTRLEKSFRHFASVFERVKLVIKPDQAREGYLNYPHICDILEQRGAVAGVAAALADANSEAVFIGTSDFSDFPLNLLVDLIKAYNGEKFVGYYDGSRSDREPQPLFGIYRKELSDQFGLENQPLLSIRDLLVGNVKLIPLPDGIDASCIGIN